MQIDTNRILREALLRLSKLENGEAILLQPYKKDRSVYIIKCSNSYKIIERGFIRKEFSVEMQKIRKSLKIVCRKEFPRSNKIWLYIYSVDDVERVMNALS